MPRKSKMGATRDSPVFQLRMPTVLREQWDAYCAKKGVAPAAQMRALMEYIIRDDMPPRVRRWLTVQVGESSPRQRIELRLTASEYAAAEERAAREGLSLTHWLALCARTSLLHDPAEVQCAGERLNESSRRLQALGRQLNEAVRRVNAGGSVQISSEQLEQLGRYIDGHIDKVDALHALSISRWLDEEPLGDNNVP